MEVAGPVPEAPELAPPVANTLLEWRWGLNTAPATFPRGFPNAPGQRVPAEYMVQILWDGMEFVGQLIGRTLLVTGGEAIVTLLAFSIEGAELRAEVDAERLGDPASFRWVAATFIRPAPLGTSHPENVDFAPSVDAGGPRSPGRRDPVRRRPCLPPDGRPVRVRTARRRRASSTHA